MIVRGRVATRCEGTVQKVSRREERDLLLRCFSLHETQPVGSVRGEFELQNVRDGVMIFVIIFCLVLPSTVWLSQIHVSPSSVPRDT